MLRYSLFPYTTLFRSWNVDMVMKVKEPLEEEFQYFKEGLILFTYLHLANEKKLTQALLDNKVIGIAYETVQLPRSEEHTSELQSRGQLVCRLLLEKKK